MRLNILIGGKAGQGPNIINNLLGEALVKKGYSVFSSREYESLIRGGHNYNLLTFSDENVMSNDSFVNILVSLDDKTVELHQNKLKSGGIIIQSSEKKENMYFLGRLFKVLCLEFSLLEEELKRLKNFEQNLQNAKQGFSEEKQKCPAMKPGKIHGKMVNGNQAIAEGAVESGVDVYFGYPMTPATAVMAELSAKSEEKNLVVLELENEIAVMNAALGSAITGAKSMCGSSGGGFDLMTEAFSMAGMAEIPVVVYLSQRPGPGTGVATGTGQGDFELARKCGHGEFFRLVAAPGDVKEGIELTNQLFYLTQKYRLPGILLADKHLAESFYVLSDEKPKIVSVERKTELIRYNSYERDESKNNAATEIPSMILSNVQKRMKKEEAAKKEAEKFEMFKIFGNIKSKNVILSWGSTKGAIIDAMKDLDVKFIQVLYIEPFSRKIKEELKGMERIIVIENNATSPLSNLIAEKCLVNVEEKNKILRYDGRAFFADELKSEIEKRIK